MPNSSADFHWIANLFYVIMSNLMFSQPYDEVHLNIIHDG
jgi:hypothetical protein